MNPLISIIIPVYNGEDTIYRCVNSIQRQTHQNLEIIIVNNASTDHTVQICQQLAEKDARIRFYNCPQKGVSVARNLGLDRATGEYIGFVDADDFIEPDMYEYLLNLLQKNHTDISSCNIHYLAKPSVPALSEFGPYTGFEALKKCIRDKAVYVVVWNKLYTRQSIGTTRFALVRTSEDFKFLYDIFSIPHTMICGKEPKYHYDRVVARPLSGRELESIPFLKQILTDAIQSKRDSQIETLQAVYLNQLFSIYLQAILENRYQEYPQLLEQMRQEYWHLIMNKQLPFKFKLFGSMMIVCPNVAKHIFVFIKKGK